jgi:hypothetical protein
MHWRAPHPRRWYIEVSAPAAIPPTSASQAVGRSIDALLPQGPDALRWHRRFNEAQMLLHEHPVNQQREARGEATVNSVWFWGGGRLPAAAGGRGRMVWTDDPLLRGLALWSGVELKSVPQDAGAWLEQAGTGDHLVLLDALAQPALSGDGPGWETQSALLERTWFAPLSEFLARRSVAKVTLTTQHAGLALNYTVLPGDLWKFWRRDAGLPRPSPPQAARA